MLLTMTVEECSDEGLDFLMNSHQWIARVRHLQRRACRAGGIRSRGRNYSIRSRGRRCWKLFPALMTGDLWELGALGQNKHGLQALSHRCGLIGDARGRWVRGGSGVGGGRVGE